MLYDFHTHTTFSDGTLNPKSLISKAAERGIKVISVTDHDTISNYSEVSQACESHNIELIKGIEISSHLEDRDVHILAYFETEDDYFKLKEMEIERKQQRKDRLYLICERLKELDVFINPETILATCKTDGTIGRPQIAREIIVQGYAKSVPDAFEKYLAAGSRAYIPSSLTSSIDVIKMVREYKGTPVLAHPGERFIQREDLLKQMIDAGLQGIEAYYPSHDVLKKNHYLNISRKYQLIATGGSDYHGPDTGRDDNLGKMNFPEAEYQRLKERIRTCCLN